MTERKALLPLLRERDEELARDGMPIGARNRIASQLREHTRKRKQARRFIPMVTFACGAALVLLVLALGAWSPRTAQPQPVAARAGVGSFTIEGDGCRSEATGGVDQHRLLGHCRLAGPYMTISTWKDAVVLDRGRNVDVEAGRVLFDVDPVRPGDTSIEIGVSGGTIEVVGTRFEVDEHGGGGHVDLFEGKIRFHEPDGTVVDVLPGTRHSWGDEREPKIVLSDPQDAELEVEILEDEPKAARHKSREPRRTAREAAEIIERVDRLRRAGRTSEGVALLRRAVQDRWEPRTAQVLSYELGEFLHRYAGDREGACRHFAAHKRRFPRDRYRKAVQRTLQRLRCD